MGKKELFKRGFDRNEDQQELQQVVPQQKLDPQQEEIVSSEATNILVVAGAGSGKTKVLTERVKHLLEKGVAPHNLVAITFTNLAAEEMRTRLKDLDGIGDAFIGTIHSFANRIMRESGKSYQLFNDELDIQYHTYLIEEYCNFLKLRKWLEYRKLRTEVETGKASEYALKTFLNESETAELMLIDRKQKDMVWRDFSSESYPEYIQSLCDRDGVISFDQLLKMAEDYFKEIGAHTEHVLVDELQDIGSLEFSFINALNPTNKFLVGDDFQSIYGFKGSNVGIFMSLASNPEFEVYYLTTNYRNAPAILETAEKVISQVDNKIEKEIIPHRVDAEGSVTISNRGKLNQFLQYIREKRDYVDWFILTRSNKELYEMSNHCKDLGIPYVTFKRDGMTLADLTKKMKSNAVKILTVHTSKGLEAKNVLLYGSFPLVCPHYCMNTEERKVMYVGVTRAKDQLIILN